MYHHIYSKGKKIPPKTTSNDDIIPNKIEDDGSYVMNESTTDDNEERLKAPKGIYYALILCVLFWLWFTNNSIWLFY